MTAVDVASPESGFLYWRWHFPDGKFSCCFVLATARYLAVQNWGPSSHPWANKSRQLQKAPHVFLADYCSTAQGLAHPNLEEIADDVTFLMLGVIR